MCGDIQNSMELIRRIPEDIAICGVLPFVPAQQTSALMCTSRRLRNLCKESMRHRTELRIHPEMRDRWHSLLLFRTPEHYALRVLDLRFMRFSDFAERRAGWYANTVPAVLRNSRFLVAVCVEVSTEAIWDALETCKNLRVLGVCTGAVANFLHRLQSFPDLRALEIGSNSLTICYSLKLGKQRQPTIKP